MEIKPNGFYGDHMKPPTTQRERTILSLSAFRGRRREERKVSQRRYSDLPLIGPNRLPPDIKMAA